MWWNVNQVAKVRTSKSNRKFSISKDEKSKAVKIYLDSIFDVKSKAYI